MKQILSFQTQHPYVDLGFVLGNLSVRPWASAWSSSRRTSLHAGSSLLRLLPLVRGLGPGGPPLAGPRQHRLPCGHWKPTPRCRSLCPVPGCSWANRPASAPLLWAPLCSWTWDFLFAFTVRIVTVPSGHLLSFYCLPNTVLPLGTQRPLWWGHCPRLSLRVAGDKRFHNDTVMWTGCKCHRGQITEECGPPRTYKRNGFIL